jgi:hypothetical protein
MKVTVEASTGAKIWVWLQDDLVHASGIEDGLDPQVCLPVDLFEVIAELAGLDLEQEDDAAEAVELADRALNDLDQKG